MYMVITELFTFTSYPGLLSQCGHAKSTGERDPTEKVVPHSLFKLASKLTPQPPFKAPSLIGCQLSQVSPFELASHEVPEIQQHVQSIIDSHSGSFGVWHPTSHSQGLSLKSLHVQQRTTHYDLAAQKVTCSSSYLCNQFYLVASVNLLNGIIL